ncbi:MAG: NUDIX hydrolase [Chloroflexota bacterium]
MAHRIRPLAICVFLHEGRILAGEGYDPLKKEFFYRPLGGQIEFGEYAAQTVHRELGEEIGAEVTALKYLGTLENIFTYNGEPGHEIVQVYDGRFVDETLYQCEIIHGHELDAGSDFKAIWKQLDEFGPGSSPLYPDGLLEMLEQTQA